jgi:hypothetical protein
MITSAGPEEVLDDDGEDEHLVEMLSKPHKKLAQVLLKYRAAFWAMGLTNLRTQVLGRGRFGVAYDIDIGGKRSVLKVTRDPYEAISSCALQGQKTQRVVPIYHVWQCAKSQPRSEDGLGWFVVHRALLNPVNKRDARILEFLYELYLDDDQDLWMPKLGASGRAMRAKWKDFIDGQYQGQNAARALMILNDLSIGGAELRQRGIDWNDFHSDNMMRDEKGILRITDVGWGIPQRSSESVPPDFTVESAREYIAKLEASKC